MEHSKELIFQKSCMVGFLTHRNLIEEKVSQGYSRLSIWKTLSDAKMIDMTYSYFLRLCRAQLGSKSKTSRQPAQETRTPAPSPRLSQSTSKPASQEIPAPETLGGFRMDPNRPIRPDVDLPKPFEWNPTPLTEEEIRTGKITSR